MKYPEWIKHAFSVDGGIQAAPTAEEFVLIQKLCEEVARRRLTAPALAFLEMARPLNFLGANAMHFFSPMVSAVTDARGYECFAKFLERRDAVDILCDKLGATEESASQSDQPHAG